MIPPGFGHANPGAIIGDILFHNQPFTTGILRVPVSRGEKGTSLIRATGQPASAFLTSTIDCDPYFQDYNNVLHPSPLLPSFYHMTNWIAHRIHIYFLVFFWPAET